MSDMAENMKQAKSAQDIVAVNKPTLQQAVKQYKKSPFSLFLRVIVTLAAVITVSVLLFLVAYIVIMGVPNLKPALFSLEYTSENASMLPALINTVIMTVMSLVVAVPVGIFSAIYLVEYAKRGNKLVWAWCVSPPKPFPASPPLCTACLATCSSVSAWAGAIP